MQFRIPNHLKKYTVEHPVGWPINDAAPIPGRSGMSHTQLHCKPCAPAAFGLQNNWTSKVCALFLPTFPEDSPTTLKGSKRCGQSVYVICFGMVVWLCLRIIMRLLRLVTRQVLTSEVTCNRIPRPISNPKLHNAVLGSICHGFLDTI